MISSVVETVNWGLGANSQEIFSDFSVSNKPNICLMLKNAIKRNILFLFSGVFYLMIFFLHKFISNTIQKIDGLTGVATGRPEISTDRPKKFFFRMQNSKNMRFCSFLCINFQKTSLRLPTLAF